MCNYDEGMSTADREDELKSYYRLYHREVVNTGIVGVVSSISHHQMEWSRWLRGREFSRVLEVGGARATPRVRTTSIPDISLDRFVS